VRTATSNGLPDATHAQNAQCAAVHFGARKHVQAPPVPAACAQEVFTLCQAPGGGHQQGKAEVGGGLGQHVRGVGGQHASSVDRGHVEVVVTDRDVGNNLQL